MDRTAQSRSGDDRRRGGRAPGDAGDGPVTPSYDGGVYDRILVGTDGSATATRAVDRAVEVAAAVGAPLTVLSVGPEDHAREVVDRELSRLSDRGVELDGAALPGDPASAILASASAGGYDLVVLGNRGMTGPRRLFTLGSVPNQVSHALACSLLIVRTT
jgi:nucleotide-binding universal stress UspA family protein